MLNRNIHQMPGLYLGFLLAGITFFGLYVFCPPPTKNVMWLSFTDTVPEATIEKITAEALAKGHRYLGRDGIDLLWGFDPRNIYREDVKIPFGLFLLPILPGALRRFVTWARCGAVF